MGTLMSQKNPYEICMLMSHKRIRVALVLRTKLWAYNNQATFLLDTVYMTLYNLDILYFRVFFIL